jgi:hypothetical protein
MNQRQAYYLFLNTAAPHYTPPLESFPLAKRVARRLLKQGFHGAVCGFKEEFDGLSWRPMLEDPDNITMPWTF